MQAGVYRHYKGGYYQVLGVGQHTETKELMVVYISLSGSPMSGPRIRIRPKAMFDDEMDYGTLAEVISEVEQEKLFGVAMVHGKRFTYVGDEIPEDARRAFRI
jgi:hypothetical protein